MILDSFENPLTKIKYPKVLVETLEYLKSADLENMPVGKHEIRGNDIFVNVAEYETFQREERIIEAHREYVDIQFLTTGKEHIGVSFFSDKNVLKAEYDGEKDLLIYEKIDSEFDLLLTPGVYAIFFTEEPHRTSVIAEKKEKVKKFVVKIRKSLLEE